MNITLTSTGPSGHHRVFAITETEESLGLLPIISYKTIIPAFDSISNNLRRDCNKSVSILLQWMTQKLKHSKMSLLGTPRSLHFFL